MFQIFAADGESQCGLITKGYSGVMTEMFSDATTFGVEFPVGSTINTKALILGATFLVVRDQNILTILDI